MSWFSLRRKFLIFLLLILTLACFVYVRRGMFYQQAKKFIEQNLAKNLPCRLSIGKITPSHFYGLVLEDMEIIFPQISGFAFNIRVKEARVDTNLWEVLFGGEKKDIQRLRLISPVINFSSSQDKLTDFSSPTSQKEKRQNFSRGEFVFILEEGQINFGKTPPLLENLSGRLLLGQNGLHLQDIQATFNHNPSNTLKIYGELTQEQLSLLVNLEHLKVKNFDILTNLALTFNKKPNLESGTTKICGTLKSYGSVLNQQPFPELNSSFEIQDAQLRILSFSLGDNYDLRGIVSLTAPVQVDLSLNFYQAVLDELIRQFMYTGESFASLERLCFSGLFNGMIKISGELNQPKIEGYLEAKQGYIGDLDFVSADINIKGRYPKITIVDSRICREEDSFLMEGEIDFSNLEKQNFLDLRFEADKGIFWQGWDITRGENNQVHMSKNVADDVKVTFDAFIEDENIELQDNYTNELALEYKILGNNLLKLRLRKEEEILGVEQRIRF